MNIVCTYEQNIIVCCERVQKERERDNLLYYTPKNKCAIFDDLCERVHYSGMSCRYCANFLRTRYYTLRFIATLLYPQIHCHVIIPSDSLPRSYTLRFIANYVTDKIYRMGRLDSTQTQDNANNIYIYIYIYISIYVSILIALKFIVVRFRTRVVLTDICTHKCDRDRDRMQCPGGNIPNRSYVSNTCTCMHMYEKEYMHIKKRVDIRPACIQCRSMRILWCLAAPHDSCDLAVDLVHMNFAVSQSVIIVSITLQNQSAPSQMTMNFAHVSQKWLESVKRTEQQHIICLYYSK